jgi:protein TonB
MHTLRLGAAARDGAARLPFPGISQPAPEGGRRRALAASLAVAVHAAFLAALIVASVLSPPEEKEEPIPIALLPPPPPPPPPPRREPEVVREAPKVKAPEPAPAPPPRVVEPKPAPAPAPKALAERRSVNFSPSAQAVQPQVINPTVIAKAAPSVSAEKLQMDTVTTVTAPREISRATPLAVESVQAAPSVASAQPSKVDLGATGGPALRGPIETQAPTGPSVGPRQVVASGKTVGTGTVAVGDGSSVREGVLSNRDVLGSKDGTRVADVNTRVGTGNLRGPGGEGTTLGGGAPDCNSRPEVQAYIEQVRSRTLARWSASGAPSGSYKVTLRFQLDVGGSASRVQLVSSDDPRVGASTVDALRAASPFAPMSDRVRCLADSPFNATFRLSSSSGGTVAN